MTMSIIVPLISPSLLFTTLATEYFGATVAALISLLLVCGYFIWKSQKKSGGIKSLGLCFFLLLVMSLLFAVVSIKEDQLDNRHITTSMSVDYDYIYQGNKIYIYEHIKK